MSVTAVVGANWGDEGKGKMTDFLAAGSDMVIRFQGGNNAGHTVINRYGKFVLHLLPSGIFYPGVVNILGPGVALNIAAFLAERQKVIESGVPVPNLVISDRAQVVLPFHLLFDRYEEERLGEKSFGSTKSGIAPFYSDKYYKTGIQVSDLYDGEYLKNRLNAIVQTKNVLLEHLYQKPDIIVGELFDQLTEYGEKVRPYVADTSDMINTALGEGRRILVEGQLGALRDPDHGIYPFTTSSSPLAGFAAVGAGVPPYAINRIIAVVKAYSSCVGAGPFVSEIFGDSAAELRERGGDAGEYGATTGRPRRMGWFDTVATKYGCRIQGATEAALTLLDVLGYLDEIPVCTAYEIGGQVTGEFPVTSKLLKAKPVLKKMKGWKCDISGTREYDKLPSQTKDYVDFVEESIGVPIKMISVGPDRDAIIMRA